MNRGGWRRDGGVERREKKDGTALKSSRMGNNLATYTKGLEHSHHRRSHTACLLMPLSMHTAGRGKLGQGLYSNRNGGKPAVVWRNTAHKHCTLWSVRGRERGGEGEREGERERGREGR